MSDQWTNTYQRLTAEGMMTPDEVRTAAHERQRALLLARWEAEEQAAHAACPRCTPWYTSSEAMPPNGVLCWVWGPHGLDLASHDRYDNAWQLHNDQGDVPVTHWQRVHEPPPPEEVGAAEAQPKGRALHWVDAALQAVTLLPGDTLVLMCPVALRVPERDGIAAEIMRAFPGHQVLVLEEGLRLGVLRAETGETETATESHGELGKSSL